MSPVGLVLIAQSGNLLICILILFLYPFLVSFPASPPPPPPSSKVHLIFSKYHLPHLPRVCFGRNPNQYKYHIWQSNYTVYSAGRVVTLLPKKQGALTKRKEKKRWKEKQKARSSGRKILAFSTQTHHFRIITQICLPNRVHVNQFLFVPLQNPQGQSRDTQTKQSPTQTL